MNAYQFLIEYLEQFPLLLKIVWGTSTILSLIVLGLIIYLKILRGNLRKNDKVVSEYQNEYESILVRYLFSGEEGESISSEQKLIIGYIKAIITDTFKRNIIVSILLKLRNEISGEMGDLIEKLYFESGLISYALSKLKNKNWYIIAIGIRELTQFQVKDVYDVIVKHVKHPKREVRKEVQLYLVNLFRFKGLEFLNDLKTPLSEWDQIQLLEVLQKFENQQIPDITLWLKSSNDSVVIFALKIVKIYNLSEVNNVLIELLTHESKEVRIDVIKALDHLYVIEAKDILKKNFYRSSIEEKILFFKMLENIFDSDDELFVTEHIHHENFEIKLSSLKILKILNSDKLKSLKLAPSEEKYVKIVEFVENN